MSQKSSEETLILESNELTKQKERETVSKKTLLLKKSIQRVEDQYLEGELHKEYSLRQSMRGIEELMEKHGIIRCQRSYFVNPRHVKVLRRDKEGLIQAELDVSGIRPVPVSPKYYEDLSKML